MAWKLGHFSLILLWTSVSGYEDETELGELTYEAPSTCVFLL